MSWNSSIQFAKLYKAYLTLSTTALTNPMIANLNMATYNINNVNTINAITGTTLTLNADPAQGITVSTKMTIPNHPLVITNNTANDSLQVHDTTSDTSIFRVDNNGNVGIKSDSSATLGHALVVNGSANITGHINVPTLPAGTNDTQVATSAFVQTAISNAKTVRVSSVITSNYNGSPPISLNNDPALFAKTAITTTLPASFAGCTSFTFYIRELTVISNSTFASGNVQFRVYPSQTLDAKINLNNGAMSFTQYSVSNSTTTSSSEYVVWNWAPTGGLTGNNIYWNVEPLAFTSPTSSTNITYLNIVYDIIGDFTTLT